MVSSWPSAPTRICPLQSHSSPEPGAYALSVPAEKEAAVIQVKEAWYICWGLDKRSPRWRTKEAFSLPPALSTQPHCCSSKKKLKQPMKLVKEQQCAEAIPPDSTMGRRAERASIPGEWLYSSACRSL